VKILLDTHILLWWMADDRRLPRPARLAIEDPANRVFVSIASLWETAIKFSLKRVVADPEALREAAERDGFSLLPIEARHCSAVARLPHHHSDPFDRLLVAQALVEPMRLLTHDSQLARYSDTVAVV
jgi:PIN domain nuclease of toxin-antitoxin system